MANSGDRLFNLVGIFVVALVYSSVHALLRYEASRTLGSDDSLTLVYAQDWAWGYTSDKPPLYIWLLAIVQKATGPNVLAVLLLRYGLFTATLLFAYMAGSRLFNDRVWAFVTALSLSLCFEIGWSLHEGVTYTAALTTMVMATLWAVFRLRDVGTWLDYFLVGCFSAFGLLSNYNFLFFLIALLLGGFSLPSFKRKMQSPRALLSLAVVLVLIAPFSVWLLTNNPTPLRAHEPGVHASVPSQSHPARVASSPPQIESAFNGEADRLDRSISQLSGRLEQLLHKGYFRRASMALRNMIHGTIVFLFPLIIVLPLLFPGWAANACEVITTFGEAGLENDKERLLLRMSAIGFGFLLLAVLVGFDRGGSQYMHPFFLPTVLLLGALAKRQMRSRRQVHLYVLVLLAASVCVVGLRYFELYVGPPMCGQCEMWEDFEPLAQVLKTVVPRDGKILTTDRATAGNLRQLFPTVPIFIAERRKLTPQRPKSNGPITVISRADPNEAEAVRDLFCQAQGNAIVSAAPSNTFPVTADWRESRWQRMWRPKSVWYVSVYSPGEVCSLNDTARPTKIE